MRVLGYVVGLVVFVGLMLIGAAFGIRPTLAEGLLVACATAFSLGVREAFK